MSVEKGLTWSGKWHIVNPHHPEANRYAIARCGAYLYRDDDPRYPEQLKRIKEGTKKSTGDCKLCNRSVCIKTATVELPEPNPNGVRRHPSWRVVVDGEPEDVYVRRNDSNEPEIEVVVSGVTSLTVAESRSLAAALLAAADAAEVTS